MGSNDDGQVIGAKRLIQEIYKVVAELERLFPGRKFTPDGHMVRSLGEALASVNYGLNLLPMSHPTHDATTIDGETQVQIKATQGAGIALRSEPDHLLVLKLLRDGEFDEVYNGPG